MLRPSSGRRMALLGLVTATALSLAGCSGTGATTAESASAEAAPNSAFIPATAENLPGTWRSTVRHYLTGDGKRGEGSETLIVDTVTNDLFESTREITLDQPADFGEGTATRSATLRAPGVINPDGSFSIMKRGDAGQFTGWLVDENTMAAVYRESDTEPWVVRETLVRDLDAASGSAAPVSPTATGAASPTPTSSPSGTGTPTETGSPTSTESPTTATPTGPDTPTSP